MRDLIIKFMPAGIKVVGPAWMVVERSIGELSKHGEVITRFTPDWARLVYEKVADRCVMIPTRESGHEIYGYVRLNGKRYRAYTSGGTNPDGGDGMIVVVQRSDRAQRRKR